MQIILTTLQLQHHQLGLTMDVEFRHFAGEFGCEGRMENRGVRVNGQDRMRRLVFRIWFLELMKCT